MNRKFSMADEHTTYKYINLVSFQAMPNWSVNATQHSKFLFQTNIKSEKIGRLIERIRERTAIKDDVLYKRVTVRLHNKGVLQRDEVLGKNIGTKTQYYVREGQFIMSKIDARNSAFGIIPAELDGAVVTQDFLVFDFNKDKILPYFFILLTSFDEFKKLCQQASSGSTGRQRINEKTFLNFEIPLSPIKKQKQLVEAYQKKIERAEKLEKEIIELDSRIKQTILAKLRLPKINEKTEKATFQIIHYADLISWNAFSQNNIFYESLKKSKYPIKRLSEVFNFTRKRWTKKKHEDVSLNYIEIGSVDSLEGITNFQKITPQTAPKRASQIIEKGDLIIGTTRPYLKRFAIVTKEFDGFIASSGFSVVKPSNHYSLYFLKHFLSSEYGIEQLKNNMSGALYPAITVKNLKQILIPFPPIEVQNEIANEINNLINTKKKLRKSISLYRNQAISDFEKAIFKTKETA